jgi:preprotein translocase subunit SecE
MNDKIRWTKRLGNFLRDVRSELKKVTWPSKNEVVNTTIVVIAATIFFGFYLFFMDIIFSWVLSQVKTLFG